MSIWNRLGIKSTTNQKEIKQAYAKLIAKYHPEEYPEKFSEIQEAYKSAISYAKKYGKKEERTTQAGNAEHVNTHITHEQIQQKSAQPLKGSKETPVQNDTKDTVSTPKTMQREKLAKAAQSNQTYEGNKQKKETPKLKESVKVEESKKTRTREKTPTLEESVETPKVDTPNKKVIQNQPLPKVEKEESFYQQQFQQIMDLDCSQNDSQENFKVFLQNVPLCHPRMSEGKAIVLRGNWKQSFTSQLFYDFSKKPWFFIDMMQFMETMSVSDPFTYIRLQAFLKEQLVHMPKQTQTLMKEILSYTPVEKPIHQNVSSKKKAISMWIVIFGLLAIVGRSMVQSDMFNANDTPVSIPNAQQEQVEALVQPSAQHIELLRMDIQTYHESVYGNGVYVIYTHDEQLYDAQKREYEMYSVFQIERQNATGERIQVVDMYVPFHLASTYTTQDIAVDQLLRNNVHLVALQTYENMHMSDLHIASISNTECLSSDPNTITFRLDEEYDVEALKAYILQFEKDVFANPSILSDELKIVIERYEGSVNPTYFTITRSTPLVESYLDLVLTTI